MRACLAVALLAVAGSAVAADRPNVLMICVDDLKPQLGCYGDPVAKTPRVDRLAASGLTFDRAYCQQALCSPSRSSLLTGRRPDATRVYDLKTLFRTALPDVVTLPQHFKNHGYFCRSLGKVYHVGHEDRASWSVPEWYSPKPRFGPAGREIQRMNLARRGAVPRADCKMPNADGPAFEVADAADDDLGDGDTAREAVAALRGLAAERTPFFLAVGFDNPHVPWVAPKKYWDLYDPAALAIPANRRPPKDAPPFAATIGDDFFRYSGVPHVDKVVPDDYARKCLHGYLAATSYVDAQVGRLLDALDETGLAKGTIVLFWGDHGLYMGEHGWWGNKHNNYEGATRVPLVVRVPGLRTAGRHTSALVEFVDLYPTLADLAGLPRPDGLEGTGFRPLLDDPNRAWKTAAFSQFPKDGKMGYAMRTDRYRYVGWTDAAGTVVARELYDHRADPGENENVAGRPENASVVEELGRRLAGGWKAAVPRAN